MLFKSIFISFLVVLTLAATLNTIQRRDSSLNPLGSGTLEEATSDNLLEDLSINESLLRRRAETQELSNQILDPNLYLNFLALFKTKFDVNLLIRSKHYPQLVKHVIEIVINLGGDVLDTIMRKGLLNSPINIDLNVNVGTGNRDAIAKVLVDLGLSNDKAIVHADILIKDLIDLHADINIKN